MVLSPTPHTPADGSAFLEETTVIQELRFEAAHRLPNVPQDHKCYRLHGHSYRCEIHVRGKIQPTSGWVMDYADIRATFEPIRQKLDHHYLNEIEGLENPTSEVLAAWIWDRLVCDLEGLSAVVVHETCTSRCVFRRMVGAT